MITDDALQAAAKEASLALAEALTQGAASNSHLTSQASPLHAK